MSNTKTAEIATLDVNHKFIFPVLVTVAYIEDNFYDADCPTLDLCAYGNTEEKALDNMRLAILEDYQNPNKQDPLYPLFQNLYKALMGIT